jgi:DNA replication protein DnaC
MSTSTQESETLESLLRRVEERLSSLSSSDQDSVAAEPIFRHNAEGPELSGAAVVQVDRPSFAANIDWPSLTVEDLADAGQASAYGYGAGGASSHPFPSQVGDRSGLSSSCSFGFVTGNRDEPFIPRVPGTLKESGLTETLVEELILKFLLGQGEATGRMVAQQIKLPFLLIEPILGRLKYEQLTTYRGATSVNDYIHVLTEKGREKARQYNRRTTYYGSAPVPLHEYCEAVSLQSIEVQRPQEEQLRRAFNDLLIEKSVVQKLGPAISSGRGMFLYGYPGNGKTSIAERITASLGKYIWIPRALLIDGEILRVFDPLAHQLVPDQISLGIVNQKEVDERWVRIHRPTIITGGELTMEMLEVQRNKETNINEAPLQMKCNCGVLVIDDFGRQRMSVDELLNRWIVPLEKRVDYLNMASGKKTQVPFDQLVIFSTNLQPKDLVDDAFLRRIPYKIEIKDPSEAAFRKLFEIMCCRLEVPWDPAAIDYLIDKHYRPNDRPFRNCHPRDLLLQIKSLCLYHGLAFELKMEYIDFACESYFSIM